MTLKERKADLEGMRAEGRPMNNASEPIMMLSGFMPSQVVPPPTRPENDDQMPAWLTQQWPESALDRFRALDGRSRAKRLCSFVEHYGGSQTASCRLWVQCPRNSVVQR